MVARARARLPRARLTSSLALHGCEPYRARAACFLLAQDSEDQAGCTAPLPPLPRRTHAATRMSSTRLVAVALVALTVVASSSLVDAIPSTTAGGPAAASTLFACGSHGDVAAQSTEVVHLFGAAKTVCCDDMQERCDEAQPLPQTCNTVECARAVDIVAQSCAATFAADGFLRTAFKPPLDQVVETCGAAQTARSDHTPTYVITNHNLQASPITTCHGRLVDGATSGFPVSITGQDAVVFQAPKGMQIKVSAQTTCFSPTASIHIYDGPDQSAPELGVLRGASLDTREFVSSQGVLRVMRAVDLDNDAGLPLIFSLGVGCACKDGDNCGEHGSCVSGTCKCDDGYSGGMCETVDDPCEAIDCGQHGHCVEGSCECTERYTGSKCDQAPKPCCSTKSKWKPARLVGYGGAPCLCVLRCGQCACV